MRAKLNRSRAGCGNNKVIGNICGSKPCSIAAEKQIYDKRFDYISSRIKTFSSTLNDSSSKHVYFVSSEDSSHSKVDDVIDVEDDGESKTEHQSISPVKGCDQLVSSCPYPSNSEEMVRLGLKSVENYKPSSASDRTIRRAYRRKRNRENYGSANRSCKILKREAEGQMCDLTLSIVDLEKFVATWKVASQKHSLTEVLHYLFLLYNLMLFLLF